VLLASFPNSLAAVTIAASGAGSVRNVSVNNISLTAPPPALPSTLQNLTLSADGPIALPALTLAGDFNVTADGNVPQSGPLTVSGLATFAAGAGNNITLNSANNFGTVVIGSANNVTLNNASALNLGASTISGALGVTAAGAILQSGTLNVSAAGTFIVTAANS